ncbi:MAG: C40 family peptidase [Cytophagales bacterium]
MRYLIYIILFFFVCFQSCKTAKTNPKAKYKTSKSIDAQRDELLKKAKGQLGVKYKAGGTNSNGFDCSGFTRFCFAYVEIKLPPTALGQSKEGIHIELGNAKKADLIFFKGGDKNSKATGHVGIILGGSGDNLEFIHASSSKGIRISKLGEKYFKDRFIGIRRIINSKLEN